MAKGMIRIWICLATCWTSIVDTHRPGRHALRKHIIIDSDMLNLVDDPEALGLANVAQACGEVHILGIMSSVHSRYVPPAMDAINTYYGHGDIPLAIQKPVDNSTIDVEYPQYHEYLTGMAYDFREDVEDGSNTTDPVSLYRTLLSSSPDHCITIANIGFHDNLYHLLLSSADNISPLTGHELVKQKVAELVVQGNPNGTSFNFIRYQPLYAEYVLTHWPGFITFIPDAIGDVIYIGSKLTTETNISKDPIAYAFATAIGVNKTHQAWDATAMYYVAHGLGDAYYFDREKGEIYFFPNGSTAWNYSSPSRLQRSVALRISNETLADRIETALLWDPDEGDRSVCRVMNGD